MRLQPVADGSLPVWTCRTLTAVHPDRLLEPVGSLDARHGGRPAARTSCGWTIDQDALATALDVHVYVNGGWGGSYRADRPSTAAATAYATAGTNHGFDLTLNLAGPGTYEVCVYGINTAGGTVNTELGCETVVSPAQTWAPYGSLDSATVAGRTVTLSGWTIDGDAPTQSLPVHVYVDGRYTAATVADRSRTDVGRAHPGTGTTHGYTTALDVAAGRHQVCIYAHRRRPGNAQPAPGLRHRDGRGRRLEPLRQPRLGHRGRAPRPSSGAGWSTPTPGPPRSRVHFYVDGRYGGSVLAAATRTDVARVVSRRPGRRTATPATCAWPAAPIGCARTRSTRRQGSTNPALGCRTVTIP